MAPQIPERRVLALMSLLWLHGCGAESGFVALDELDANPVKADAAFDARGPHLDAARADARPPAQDMGPALIQDAEIEPDGPLEADAALETLPDSARPADVGPDARRPVDAAQITDAMLPVDSSPVLDAVEPDAFSPDGALEPDATQAPDAAPTPDATGLADATPDAAGPCGPGPACGLNDRGRFPGHCEAGEFVADGPCRDPDGCRDGMRFDQACGADGLAVQPWICDAGQFRADGPCVDPVCLAPLVAGLGETWGPPTADAVHQGSCGGAGAERAFSFTAPRTSTYAFRSVNVAFDTAVYLRTACADAESELDCAAGSPGVPAQVLRDLVVGETVVALVDALHGDVGLIGLGVSDACLGGLVLASPEVELHPAGTVADLAFGTDARAPLAAVALVTVGGGVPREVAQVALLDAVGGVVAAPVSLSDAAARAVRVVAQPAGGYLTIRIDVATGSLFAREISADGALGADVRLTRLAPDPDARTLSVVRELGANPGLWVVWTEGLRDELDALRMDAAGQITLAPVVLNRGIDPALEPAAVPEADGGVAVAFGDRDEADSWASFGRYDARGVGRGGVHHAQMSAEGSLECGLARAGVGFALAYEDRVGGVRHAMLRRYDDVGTPVGVPLQLTQARDGGSRPRLATANGELGVVYTEIRGVPAPEPQLVFQALTAAGARRGPAIALTERSTERAHTRLVAASESEFALTYWEAGLRRAFLRRGSLGCPP